MPRPTFSSPRVTFLARYYSRTTLYAFDGEHLAAPLTISGLDRTHASLALSASAVCFRRVAGPPKRRPWQRHMIQLTDFGVSAQDVRPRAAPNR